MISTSLSILLALGPPTASVPTQPAAAQSGRSCGDAAKLYKAEVFAAAAEAYECRAAVEHAPKDLYWAAVARTRAGHRSRAAQAWQVYFAVPDADPQRRARAQVQYEDLQKRLHDVRVTVRPHDPDGTMQLSIKPDGAPGQPPLVFTRRPDHKHTFNVRLEHGSAVVEARQPDATLTRTLPVGASSLHMDFARPRHGLIAGFAVGGALALGGGVALVIAGPRMERVTQEPGCMEREPACLSGIKNVLAVRDAGVGLVAASVPAMLTGAISIATDRRRRNILWGVESAIGGLATIAGAVIVVAETAEINRRFVDAPSFSVGNTNRALGSALLGFGASAASGGVLGLILESRSRHGGRSEVGVSPHVTPTSGSIELRLRF